MRSRRDFIRLAGAAAVPPALLSACGTSGGERLKKLSPGEVDFRLLNRILNLEHAGIAAYTEGAHLMHGRALATAREFLSQEREHAAALARAIRTLGGTPNEPKTQEEYRRSFPALNKQDDALRFAVDLENRIIRGYVESLPRISSPNLRRMAAEILTTEAEHVSVLLGERGLPQVPSAFVTGTVGI